MMSRYYEHIVIFRNLIKHFHLLQNRVILFGKLLSNLFYFVEF